MNNDANRVKTNEKRAREIMGINFFGPREANEHFGVTPTRQQRATLSEIPFSEEALKASRDTHVLVAVFPLSILEIRGKVDSKLFYDQSWYNKESFAKERGEVSWQLVRKTPVPNSTSKNWQEQQVLLSKDDEVPTAQVMVYAVIGYFLATGERLLENDHVRTSSLDLDGDRVVVGDFDSRGLFIGHYYRDGGRNDNWGVASVRKF